MRKCARAVVFCSPSLPSHRITALPSYTHTHTRTHACRRKYQHRNLGATDFKHHLLGELGWDVVQLPHFEWEPLRNAAERVEYLRAKLEPLGVVAL